MSEWKMLIRALIFSILSSGYIAEAIPAIKIEPFPILPWTMPQQNEKNIKIFKEANFTVVWLTPVNENNYQQMKKYWDGNFILSTWWNKEAKDRLNGAEELLKFHPEDPKKIGYFIKDEPDVNMIKDIKQIKDLYDKADPTRISFVNLYPQFAGEVRIGCRYQDYLDTYFELLKPIYCSFDNYPCYWFNLERKDYYYNLEQMYTMAARNNSSMIGFVQVFSTTEYRDVSESDLAWQVYSLLAYGCKGLWYFPYEPFDKDEVQKGAYNYSEYPVEKQKYNKPIYAVGDSVVDRKRNPSYAFPYVKRINGEVLIWGPLLTNLNSTCVRHTGRIGIGDPAGAETFHPESNSKHPGEYITNVRAKDAKEDMGFLVGFFKDENKHLYAMVVNKRHGENMTCKQGSIKAIITLRPTIKKAYSVSNTKPNTENILNIVDGKINIELAGGSAILMRLEE